MKALLTLAVALVVLAVAAGSGCGGDDDDAEDDSAVETTATQTTDTTGEAGGGATTIEIDEYSFDPDDVSVLRGDTVTVENTGNIAHNLTIETGPEPRQKSEKLAGTSTFLGGRSERLQVDLDPGEYAMVCTVPGHRELGMFGTVAVR